MVTVALMTPHHCPSSPYHYYWWVAYACATQLVGLMSHYLDGLPLEHSTATFPFLFMLPYSSHT